MHEAEGSRTRSFTRERIIVVSVAVVIIVTVVGGLVYAGVIPLSTIFSCLGTAGTSKSFTIIATQNGYNNSKTLASQNGFGPWPIMNVARCDNVKISLVNTDTQSHGLAVGGYTGEFSIAPGQTLSVHFTADKVGNWRVFCTIICSVHDFMQNGQLNVT